MKRVGVALLAPMLAACAPEPLEFADWTLPVAEDVRVIGYPATPPEERTARIELVEDLVLGLDESNPNQAFYSVRDVDVDAAGNLWVLDAGNHRVQVFDRGGSFVRSLGREGQGPGEFESPTRLAIVGDRLVVRAARSRLSLFDLDGEHVEDAIVEDVSSSLSNFFGRDDGSFIASYTKIDTSLLFGPGFVGTLPAVLTVSRFSLEAAELQRYAAIDSLALGGSSGATQRPAAVARPFSIFSASNIGDVYVTTEEQYQMLAFDPDAEPKWALRVAYVPAGLSEEIIERALEAARRRRPETTRADLIWPEKLPALDHLAVDGHGHVYVYPHFDRGEGIEDRPVDVYSPGGERLFTGMIQDRFWRRADGDFVYAAGTDRISGEPLVWRWRLNEPF